MNSNKQLDKNAQFLKQAEAELGQAQYNWTLGFGEAEVGAEFGNKSYLYCWNEAYSSSQLTLIYYI